MSFNQPRSDKNEPQYRRTGRTGSFNQNRGPQGSFGRGSGGPAPSPSISSNRSFNKKSNNNAQGGQSRAPNVPNVNFSSETNHSIPRGVQNGAHVQPQLHVAPDAPVSVPAAKQAESAPPKSFRGVPKAPTSQHAPVNSGAAAPPATPTKAPGDGSKPFLQFGSISPGFVNGMQIPARTSSAPPNLDEQKRDQARQEPYRAAAPALPTPVPKQQQQQQQQQVPRKELGAADQPNAPESHPAQKVKKDVQVSPAPPSGHGQKPSGHPMGGMSMPIQFHQAQVSMPYGSNQQMQSQGVTPSPHQIPMQLSLPIGSGPQVQQPMFVPNLPPLQMQHQGIIHQGHNLSFNAQMAQMPSQIGNIGINMGPPYSQQQAGKFPAPRKTPVKITNPKTHEEVTFENVGSAGPRPHQNVPPQSQTIAPFQGSHPMGYYQAPYANNMYYQNPSSQMPASRYNYPGTGSQNVKIMNPPSLNALPVNKPGFHMHGMLEQPNLEHARDLHNSNLPVTSGTTHVTVKPAVASREKREVPSVEMAKQSGLTVHVSSSQSSTDKSLKQSKPVSDSAVVDSSVIIDQPAGSDTALPVESRVSTAVPSSVVPSESVPVLTANAEIKQESLSKSNSSKDQAKKSVNKGISQSQHQVGGQSDSVSSSTSQTSESGVAQIVESCTALSPKSTSEDVTIATKETVVLPTAVTSNVVSKTETILESSACVTAENSGVLTAADDSVSVLESLPETEEQEKDLSEGPNEDLNKLEVSSESNSLQSVDPKEQEEQECRQATVTDIVIPPLETAKGMDEPVQSHSTEERAEDEVLEDCSIVRSSVVDESLSKGDNDNSDLTSAKYSEDSFELLAAEPAESIGVGTDDVTGSAVSVSVSTGSKDKPPVELARSKSSTSRGKKKRKELLQKADAAGTSDLYLAYKSPEEIKEILVASEVTESTSSSLISQQVETDLTVEDDAQIEDDEGSKAEPDDWEVAADTKPKFETETESELAHGEAGLGVKKYSRDFLLKFADQCTTVPERFEIGADIAEILASPNAHPSHFIDRSSLPSPGRVIDRPAGPRLDRRNSGVTEDERWNKMPGHFAGPGRGNLHLDLNFAPNAGFRPVQGANFAGIRNARVQSPGTYAGGLLSGPMQSMGPHGGMQRNSPDSDKWQRASSFQQRGLIPSPQTPFVTMHKTEKRYEVGKVTDEEQAKQRQLKAILNKLTPQNFDKLFEQVKTVNIDQAGTLRGVITQIFDKALMEPTFCEMYANFCHHLSGDLPDFIEGEVKVTFKRLLLNKCQEEFERGEREQEEANKADEEGEVKQTAEEREEKRVSARRRMLGNIRLIGELFKKRMLTERIMHECIKKLLGQHQTPDEEDIEALCKLMSTIGQSIDHSKAKEHMDAYFEAMSNLSNNMNLSSRVRFMLKDSIDLRKNNWQQRRKVEGPKKIDEVHRDAAQERQAQTSRLGRGSSINSTGGRRPQMDFGPRGSSMASSPGSQMGNYRSMPIQQGRGFGSQDVRTDERHTYDPRPLMSMMQRPGDDAITLGPQGGLARGMSSRGPHLISPSMPEMSPGGGRFTAGLNGYNSASDRGHSQREDLMPRFVPDRGQAAYDQSSASERNVYGGRDVRNPDSSYDRSLLSSPPSRGEALASTSTPAEKVLSEEALREKSKTAIKEYYSARDVGEVAFCINDLNSPSFHPTMVSIWVTESFEAKDKERDLLASLLVKLTTSTEATLTPAHLKQGFESVLEFLEDTVTDAPMAPQYLGRMFAKVITENVVPLGEIGQLIHDGGEEPGSLLNSGLAGNVLGNVLEIIESEKGDKVLKELIKVSSLRLETFRPPGPQTSRILEKFIDI